MTPPGPTSTCQNCGGPMFRARTGPRTSKYPYCAMPECRKRAATARVYASRWHRYNDAPPPDPSKRLQPFTIDELRGMLWR